MWPRRVLIFFSRAHLSLSKCFLRYNHQLICVRHFLTSQCISSCWISLMRFTTTSSSIVKNRFSTRSGTSCAWTTTVLWFNTIWVIIINLKAHWITNIICIKHFERLTIIKHVLGYVVIDFNKWDENLAGSLLIGIRAESFENWFRYVR